MRDEIFDKIDHFTERHPILFWVLIRFLCGMCWTIAVFSLIAAVIIFLTVLVSMGQLGIGGTLSMVLVCCVIGSACFCFAQAGGFIVVNFIEDSARY